MSSASDSDSQIDTQAKVIAVVASFLRWLAPLTIRTAHRRRRRLPLPPPPFRLRARARDPFTKLSAAAADVLLWRRRSIVAAAVLATVERAGYSILSVIFNALLLVTILFFWAKSTSLLNRPLPPVPNLEIPDETTVRVAAEMHVWIGWVLSVARDIAIKRDRKVFLKVILVLWLISYIGSFFNFLTLVYIAFLLCITVPALYEKCQDQVDKRLDIVHGLVIKQYDSILGNGTRQSIKEKKTP